MEEELLETVLKNTPGKISRVGERAKTSLYE